MVINTNTTSLFAQRTLDASSNNLSKSLSKLSSGSRIITPDDDAAGLAVSMKFRAEIGRIGAARSNVGNAMSFSQTQDGYLSTVDKALRRMSELSVLAADQTKSNTDVENYNKEFVELKEFITRTASKEYNGVGLFSSATLVDKELGANDALLKTQYDALTAELATWSADPADVASASTITGITSAAGTEIFTKTAHGMTTGMKVTFVSATAGATSGGEFEAAGEVAYVKEGADANTFTLYSDAALTTQVMVDTDHAALVLDQSGDYSKLKALREDIALMAREWAYKEDGTGANAKTEYSSVLTGNTAWADVYDFWQTRTSNSWSGVRAHTDGYTTALAADHELHVGNAGAVTDSLIEGYKKMVSDIKSYVNNNAAGLEITDNSAATSYQLKGADVSFIETAISSATDTNTVTAALTKTNGATYVTRINSLINDLAGTRAYVGANMSRLNMVGSQLAVYGENLSAANSRIEDIDIARETANFSKQQILVQSGTAMLAQANVLPQSALQLLQ